MLDSQQQPAATAARFPIGTDRPAGPEQPRGRPDREDIEPGEEPGGPEPQQQEPQQQEPQQDPECFDFQQWFDQRGFNKGQRGFQSGSVPGERSDYQHVADLLDISPDYVQRLATGARHATKRIAWACRMLDAVAAE